MRVLVACEESGTVRDAFRAQGHDAWSCDLQECSGDPVHHYQCNVFEVLGEAWDLLIAHPTCQFLANSGARWLYDEDGNPIESRWESMRQGAGFFRVFLEQHHIPRIAVENPIPVGHAGLPPYTQVIQPWQFGDNFSKATCLWLKGLPPLVPTVLSKPADVRQACWLEPPGPDRAKNRSKTYPGIAAAMAQQWGSDFVPAMELSA